MRLPRTIGPWNGMNISKHSEQWDQDPASSLSIPYAYPNGEPLAIPLSTFNGEWVGGDSLFATNEGIYHSRTFTPERLDDKTTALRAIVAGVSDSGIRVLHDIHGLSFSPPKGL